MTDLALYNVLNPTIVGTVAFIVAAILLNPDPVFWVYEWLRGKFRG